MRIDSILSPLYRAAAQSKQSRVDPLVTTAGGGQSDSRPRQWGARAAGQTTDQTNQLPANLQPSRRPWKNVDQVELATKKAAAVLDPTAADPTITSTADTGATPSDGPVSSTDQTGASSGQTNTPFAGLIEQYYRQHAAVTFTIPGQGPFGPIQFMFEVESAYRIIRPIDPGTTLDTTA